MRKLALAIGLIFVTGTSYAIMTPGLGGGGVSVDLTAEAGRFTKEIENVLEAEKNLPELVGPLDADSAVFLLRALASDLLPQKIMKDSIVEQEELRNYKRISNVLAKQNELKLLDEAANAIRRARNPKVLVGFSFNKEGQLVIHLEAEDFSKLTQLVELANLKITLDLEKPFKEEVIQMLKAASKVAKNEAKEREAETLLDLISTLSSEATKEIVDTLATNLDQLRVIEVVSVEESLLQELLEEKILPTL